MADVRIVSTTPCDCCGSPAPTILFECRTKGGVATLIGFAPYTGGGNERYLTETFSGTSTGCVWNTTDCSESGFVGSAARAYTGTNSYDPSTGVRTNAATLTIKSGSVSCGSYESETTEPAGESISAVSPASYSLSPTEEKLTSGGCLVSFGKSQISAGSTQRTLSNQDTVGNAITRLIANSDWSEWVTGNCSAAYGNQSGISVVYVEAEWRVNISGLVPFRAYNLTVRTYRGPIGGPYTLYQTSVIPFVASAGGTYFTSGSVPNDQGYSTYVDHNVEVS